MVQQLKHAVDAFFNDAGQVFTLQALVALVAGLHIHQR